MRKEVWFGLSIMAAVVALVFTLMPAPSQMTNGHLGLLMLALIVVGIMLGFPTAFTLMGMGVIFGWFAYRSADPSLANRQILDLMVQRAYSVMSNDVLIAIPLFVFMGYLVERAALIDRLFKSLHLATARVPGALAVATIVTCAIFATATGIVGAVVTLMGLLALPAMLKAGYNTKIAAGAITAGGCLGILIPPSVLLIVYGAVAGVSVVKLYAGAFGPGIMLAALYVGFVIVLAKLRPNLMPPLPLSERAIAVPPFAQRLAQHGSNALAGLWRAVVGDGNAGVAKRTALAQLFITLIPALFVAAMLAVTWQLATAPTALVDTSGLVEAGAKSTAVSEDLGAAKAPGADEDAGGLQEPPSETPKESAAPVTPKAAEPDVVAKTPVAPAAAQERLATPTWFWIVLVVFVALLAILYRYWNWVRLEVFKMLLSSFFPLAILILMVLGSIVFGLATPTEAAAVGALGGGILAAGYRFVANSRAAASSGKSTGATVGATARELGGIVKDSAFLTAKTSAMVCWLFVGSSIFSASFALLGGQEIINRWVLSLDMTPVQFMILAQIIIFLLGWPLEWTEIIVIFMPIFIPLLPHFGIDPLFFGLLVALNLQTAFLSPPVAMAAFYLKGVSPPHVTLNAIFMGMMPFMGIQVIALVLLYVFPEIGMWLPTVLYK
ncbi:MAG TPA: TRAP transporter large permease subunit [Casimicrobiaceae bacterium]|jgi:TRAP-type mannitol/chloroaromatic compound transport system permease large subunit